MHLFSGCVSIVVEWSSLPCFSPIYIQKSQLFPFYSSAQLITRFQLCVWLWLWVCISVRFDLHSPKKTLFNDNSSLCEAVCHMSARSKEYEASKLSHVCNRDDSLNTNTGKLDFSLILLLCILASGRRNETPVCVRVWVRIFAPVSFFSAFLSVHIPETVSLTFLFSIQQTHAHLKLCHPNSIGIIYNWGRTHTHTRIQLNSSNFILLPIWSLLVFFPPILWHRVYCWLWTVM